MLHFLKKSLIFFFFSLFLFFNLSAIKVLLLTLLPLCLSHNPPACLKYTSLPPAWIQRDNEKDLFQPKQRLLLQQSTAGTQHRCFLSMCAWMPAWRQKQPINPTRKVLRECVSTQTASYCGGELSRKLQSDSHAAASSHQISTALVSKPHTPKIKTVLLWRYCTVPESVLTPRARRRALSSAPWVRGGPTEESLLTGGTVAK